MRTLNRTMRIAVDAGEDQEHALQQFLKAYRQTPHSTTGCAPSDALMRRDLRDVIPAGPKWKPAQIDPAHSQEKRRITNEKASRTRRATRSNLVVGDRVVVRDRHPGWKFRTRFEREPWMVTRVKGTMITATRQHQVVTRNISWFKRASQGMNPAKSTEQGREGPMTVVYPGASEESPHGENMATQGSDSHRNAGEGVGLSGGKNLEV